MPAEPQRRSPARKPTVMKMQKYLVRLWEVERKRGAVPAQIRGFDVEANAIHKARDAVKFELANTRRRVVRSLSFGTDGVFTAVVFKNEVRVEHPTKVSEFPLRRDAAAESVAIAAAHAARRGRVRKAAAEVVDITEARKKRKAERDSVIAAARKKQAAKLAQARAKLAEEQTAQRKDRHEARAARRKKKRG